MKDEDRQALRIFYQELAKQSFTKEQFSLYWALEGSKADRVAWLKANMDKMNIPADIQVILNNMDKMNKADLSIIAASVITPYTAPVLQKQIDSVWTWKIWPWNWF
jgi:hypothetical protein